MPPLLVNFEVFINQNDLVGETILEWTGDVFVPVPEPSTLVAGALLLLPFGASTLRILRKSRKA